MPQLFGKTRIRRRALRKAVWVTISVSATLALVATSIAPSLVMFSPS